MKTETTDAINPEIGEYESLVFCGGQVREYRATVCDNPMFMHYSNLAQGWLASHIWYPDEKANAVEFARMLKDPASGKFLVFASREEAVHGMFDAINASITKYGVSPPPNPFSEPEKLDIIRQEIANGVR